MAFTQGGRPIRSATAKTCAFFVIWCLSAPVCGQIVIDPFSGSNGSSSTLFGPGFGASINQASDGLPRRDVRFEYLTGAGPINYRVNFGDAVIPSAGGLLIYAGASSSVGILELEYDGGGDGDPSEFDLDGLGSVDLTQGSVNNGFNILTNFGDVPTDVRVTVASTGGTATSTATLRLPGSVTTPANFGLLFSAFDPNIDFADVSAIRVEIEGVQGLDLELDSIVAAAGVVATPPGLAPPPGGPRTVGFDPSRPGILIDDFSTGGGSAGGGGPGGGGGGVINGGGIGGSRDFEEEHTGTEGIYGRVINLASENQLNRYAIRTDSRATVDAEIHWDGPDGSSNSLDVDGLGSIDLTNEGLFDRLAFGVAFNDVPNTLVINVYSNAGSNFSTAQLLVPAGVFEPADFHLPFSQFIGNANFSDISAIEMRMSTTVGLDFELDYIVATIPEPASVILAALSVAGLLLCRCRSIEKKSGQNYFRVMGVS